MALTQTGRLEANVFSDLEINSSSESLATSAITLYSLLVNNTQNTSAVFVKLWNLATAPGVGTDAPDYVFRVKAGGRFRHIFSANGLGRAFSAGCRIACVTTGGTPGSQSPSNKVTATIHTN